LPYICREVRGRGKFVVVVAVVVVVATNICMEWYEWNYAVVL